MGLKEDVEELKLRVESIPPMPEPVVKNKKWSLPLGVKFKAAKSKKQGKVLVIWLGSDRKIDFRVCDIDGGIVKVGDYQFKPYDSRAVYHFKRWSVIVVPENRLKIISDRYDDFINDALEGADLSMPMDGTWKKGLSSLNDYAQQTMIRIIEKIEVDKELGKKKGKLPIVWIIIGLGIVLYILGSAFGVV